MGVGRLVSQHTSHNSRDLFEAIRLTDGTPAAKSDGVRIQLAGLALLGLLGSTASAGPSHDNLWRIASTALKSNRVKVGDRQLLVAGRYQFSSAWTRDFAFASRGLLAIGDTKTVRDQLDTILEHATPEGLVPRALDTIPIGRRVVVGMLRGRLDMSPNPTVRTGKLKAQVLDEHHSPSMDSNVLVIEAAMSYAKAANDPKWLDGKRAQLGQLFRFYKSYTDTDGLIVQPKYSDWQDSVKREGKSFYVNLLYATTARRMGADSGMTETQIAALEAKVKSTFFDGRSGLFKSLAGDDYISLDGNLMALDSGFVDPDSKQGRDLYAAMKKSPLWTRGGVPGSTTVGDYPKSWLHLPARISGLSHYHDELHWSWLTALSAKVADRMGDHDEAQRIFDVLGTMAERDGTVGEIYQQKKAGLLPFKSPLYHSEAPFSWGAGMVLDAMAGTSR